MVAATSEGLERVSAERRARWLRRRRRRRAFWAVVAVATVAAIVTGLWPRGSAPAGTRGPLGAGGAARPHSAPARADLALKGLRAALPVAYGLTHGDPAQRMVALTFDDGPSGRTPPILRVLSRNHAHATFFVVGRATRGMEPVLRHIAATGNELADHTYSHADLLALRAARAQAAAAVDARARARATGGQPHFFRPPYGATGPAVNRLGRTLGLIPVLWSVDSRDWQLPGTQGDRAPRARQRAAGRDRAHARRRRRPAGDPARAARHPARLQRRHLQVVTLSRMFATAPAGELLLERLLRGRRRPLLDAVSGRGARA